MKFVCCIIISMIFLLIDLAAQTNLSPKKVIAPLIIVRERSTIDSLNNLADTLCLRKDEKGRQLAKLALQKSLQVQYAAGAGDAYHNLGLMHFRRNNDSALYYFRASVKNYQREYPGFEKMAFAINNLSRTFHEQLLFDSALIHAQKAMAFVNKAQAGDHTVKKKWQMYTLGAMANAYAGQSRYDSANAAYLNAIRIAEELGQKRMLEVYFKGLSGIQSELRNYEQAASYARKAISFIENDNRALSISLANLAVTYSRLQEYTLADVLADSSLSVGRRSNVWNSVGRNYATLGYTRMQLKQYHQALDLFKEGMKLATEHHNSRHSISLLHVRMGEAYERMDSLLASKLQYRQALEVASGDPETTSDVYLALSRIAFRENKVDSAYLLLKKYSDYRDTVFTAEKLKSITELNTRYQTEKKDQQLLLMLKEKELSQSLLQTQSEEMARALAEKQQQDLQIANFELATDKQEQLLRIQQLDIENNRVSRQEQQMKLENAAKTLDLEKKEKELAEAALHEQRNWFVFLMAGLLLVAALLYLLFNKYRLQKKIQNQQALLKQREIISRELHDELGATLSGIAMYSHLAKEQMQQHSIPAITGSLNIIQQNAGEMVNKLNDIVWLLNPGNDNLRQLLQRLEDYAVQMAPVKGIKVQSNVHEYQSAIELPVETRRNLYLLFKEAINNAVKYSRASVLQLYIEEKAGAISMRVEDNGIGFETHEVKNGNGLKNMEFRARAMGAVFNIASKKGAGTCISIQLAIPQ